MIEKRQPYTKLSLSPQQKVSNMEHLEYNTQLKKLILPEYGRKIQNMVEHALTIEDRSERNRCAETIIALMANMTPQMKNIPDFRQKLWDHLAIMSDFKLDIDYPFSILRKESFRTPPEAMPYPNKSIRYLHYGSYLEQMIEKWRVLETPEEKRQLLTLIILQMRKSFTIWNKDLMDDDKLATDLREYSKGELNLSGQEIRELENQFPISKPNLKKKKQPLKKGRK